MKLSMKQLGGILGAAALTVGGLGLLGTSGCDEVAEQCGFVCANEKGDGEANGVLQGNFAITGNAGIDGFFKSVVNFKGVATSVAADIKAEIDGIALAFGISPAELKADFDGNLAAAIQSKFNAKLVVDAQPPKCEVDASFQASATVECQASAGCDVDPGSAELTCMGSCSVEVEASAECDAEATVKCELSGPKVACSGECSGSCTLEAGAKLDCEGTCHGECMGTCSAENADGSCAGTCDGECRGSCELTGMAAANCTGSCNGSCKMDAPEGGCDASAKVSCEVSGSAAAKCEGSCKGEVMPPQVECDASASCEASAKADASFNATCTPPSISIRVEVEGSLDADAEAQLNFGVEELKKRLPRLKAAVGKADLVLDASGELVSNGKTAVQATIDAFAKGKIDAGLAYKLTSCNISGELEDSAQAIAKSSETLTAQVTAAGKLGM